MAEGSYDQRNVSINLISAKDVKNRYIFKKQSPTAEVSVTGATYPQVSRPSKHGGSAPVWNQTLDFSVKESLLLGRKPVVHITLYSSSKLSGKPLGSVTIPLLPCILHVGEPQYGAHTIVRHNGDHKGIINVSLLIQGQPFTPEQIEASQKANATAHHAHPPPQNFYPPAPAYMSQPGMYAAGGYASAPPPGYYGSYPAAYSHQPNMMVHHNDGSYGGNYHGGHHGGNYHGGRHSRGYGGDGFGGAGLATGLMVGALGGLVLAEALDNDGGGCGGGGCGGGCGG